MKKLLYVVTLALAAIPSAFANPPATFTEAKVVAKQKNLPRSGKQPHG